MICLFVKEIAYRLETRVKSIVKIMKKLFFLCAKQLALKTDK